MKIFHNSSEERRQKILIRIMYRGTIIELDSTKKNKTTKNVMR